MSFPCCPLTCPKTDLTIGWRVASYSEKAAEDFLPERLDTGGGGAGVTGGGGSEARLREDPACVRSLDSKNNSASSVVFVSEGVGEGFRCGRECPCWLSGGEW